MELWDLYDKDKKPLGKDHVRGNPLPDNAYHLVVHVWIKNLKGEYLISKRSANRQSYPGFYECVGGSVLKGETSLQGALRETLEEVGIKLNKRKGKVVYSKVRGVINGVKFNDIMEAWVFEYNGDVDLAKSLTDEVQKCEWLTKEQIFTLNRAKILVPTLEYFFDKICK